MPPEKDIVPLIVQRHHLPSHQLRPGRKDRPEQVRRQYAERGLEVVQDELRVVRRRVAVAGQCVAGKPVAQREVEGGTGGQVHDREADRAFLVFLEHEQGGEVAVAGEAGDFAHGKLVSGIVPAAADVGAVGEDGGQQAGFVVEGAVDGGGDENLRFGGGREEGRVFLGERRGH